MPYLILEMETGYMDGWYSNKRDAEGVLEYFDEIRPEYTHTLLKRVRYDLNFPRITDRRFLATHVYNRDIRDGS